MTALVPVRDSRTRMTDGCARSTVTGSIWPSPSKSARAGGSAAAAVGISKSVARNATRSARAESFETRMESIQYTTLAAPVARAADLAWDGRGTSSRVAPTATIHHVPTGGRFVFEPFELDPARRRLLVAGEPVAISDRQLDVLSLLVQRAGQIVSKDELILAGWKDVAVGDNSLEQALSSLLLVLAASAGR